MYSFGKYLIISEFVVHVHVKLCIKMWSKLLLMHENLHYK